MAADASCEDVTAAGVGDEEVDGNGNVLQPNVMKHNNLQLQELLRLARSCLKYDRLPGELSERGFFDKFDAQQAERSKSDADLAEQSQQQDASVSSASAAALMEDLTLRPSLELSPPMEGPGEDPPDVQTLKEQTAQIERATAEAQQAIEAANAELRNEVVKRWQLDRDEKAREVDLQRAQHQLRLAKGMVKRQNVEIKELHANVRTLELAASSTQSAPAAMTTPQPPSGPARQKVRPAPRLVPQGPRARAAAKADAEAVSAASSQGGGGVVEQATYPRHQSLVSVTTAFLPPKSRIMESVLTTSNKSADTWKLYIP